MVRFAVLHTGCFTLGKVEVQAMEPKQWCSVPLGQDVCLFLCISLFCLLCLSLTQLRVLGRNPASYAEAHSLSHSLGLPCQPGRLHAAEASWPSSPAPAESQRHVMPSGCPPARFPTVLGLR